MNLPLNAPESRWLAYVRENVVGRLEGSSEQRARTAAIVAWWALKEGIYDLPNPLRHNLCSAAGERQIGDLGTCPSGAWQIGISGIQGNAVSLADAEAVAARLYPGERIPAILERVALESGVEGSAVDQIRNAAGALRKAWLLRDGAIGFTLQRPFVERCLAYSASAAEPATSRRQVEASGIPGWCYGGWDSARRFASSPERVREVIGELEDYFEGAPVPGSASRVLGGLLVVAGLAGMGYWAYREGYLT